MTTARLKSVLCQVRTALGGPSLEDPTDQQLLDRFLGRRDEDAFADIVRRHGGLVLGLCRRLLHQRQDAEDAFQATFFVLAQKAGSIRKRGALRCWLYGVAYRIARKLRADRARQAALEVRPEDVARPDTTAEAGWCELRAVLDEELNRLPERYRLPLLLCYLEGRTRDEAAEQLGWGLGVLRGRLERGRLLLRGRLTRRGLTLGAALPAALVAADGAAAVPDSLVQATVGAALSRGLGAASGQALPPAVTSLAAGVLKSMAMSKRLTFVSWGLALALLAAGAVAFAHPWSGEGAPDRDGLGAQPPAGKAPAELKRKEMKGPAEFRRRVEASDRIVVGKFALQAQTEPAEPKLLLTRALKGPRYSDEERGLRVTGVKGAPAVNYQTDYIFFLRSAEEESGFTGRPSASPAVPKGWFVPATAETLKKVQAAIPLPKAWGKAADGLRLGLRLRRSRVKVGEEVVAEVSLKNVSGKKLTVAQHRLNIYDYWPDTRFRAKAPNGKEYVLAKPSGEMREADFALPFTLQPGETYVHAVRLNVWPVSQPPLDRVAANLFVEPGIYSLSCTYVPSVPSGRSELVKLSSPPVKLEVVKDGLGKARLSGVRTHLDRFHVTFSLQPDETPEKRDLRYKLRYVALDVPPTPREPHAQWPDGTPMGADARITKAEAGRVVDLLARQKYFEQAVTPLGKEPDVKRPNATISVSHGGTNPSTQYALKFPLNAAAVKQLRDLRDCLDDKAGKLLDRLLEPVVQPKGKADSPEKKQKAGRLRPHRFTEGGGYEWRGVFEVEGTGAKRKVYLCDLKDRKVRILMAPGWTRHVLEDWENYRGRAVEGSSFRDEEPLGFRSLGFVGKGTPQPPKKGP